MVLNNDKHILNIGLVQMTSAVELKPNLQYIDMILAQSANCDMVIFPEYVLCLGTNSSVLNVSKAINIAELGLLAKKYAKIVVFGGVPVQVNDSLYNATLIYNAHGQLLHQYNKIHLFQMKNKHGYSYDETEVFEHGHDILCVDILGWKMTFCICYDIRFPELFRKQGGADLIICTACFTQSTGRDHWHLLLKARAVENQCFVVASAQCGSNEEISVPKYGHSLAIEPWGKVILDVGADAIGLFQVQLHRELIAESRKKLPALANRRIH